MYLDYFHLTQAPFSITPDPEFVYLSEKHQESLAHLVYGVTRGGGAGFVQLTGEVGTGKTTISRLFLQKLPEQTQAALILNPNITPLELLENIFKEFGLSKNGLEGQLNALIGLLNSHLLSWYEAGKNTVIIIDEAQNIPRDTLEQLRLLTNLETSQQKLLQIVLIGQPELKALMQRRDLRQLSQRITSRFHLQPLSIAETKAYIQHRLSVAGGQKALFNSAVCKKIHAITAGTPRLINTLCDRALLAAYVEECHKVKIKHIKQAKAEVLGVQEKAWYQLPKRVVLLLVVLLLFVVVSFWAVPRIRSNDVKGQVANAAETAVPPVPVTITNDDSVIKQVIQTPENHKAWLEYYQLWHANEEITWHANSCPDSKELGMSCLRRQGNLNQIQRLNTPVLLELSASQLLLLQSVNGDDWQVLTSKGLQEMDRSVIEDQWFGTYFVLWPLAQALIDDTMSNDVALWVQSMASIIENRPMTLEQSQFWVVEFQQKNGLLADGIVGKETRMALALQAYQGPKLN